MALDENEMQEDGQLYEVVETVAEPMEGVVEIQDPAVDLKVENESLKGDYTWEIAGWSKITDSKIYSENFEVGTHIWRILVCPRGMNQPGHLSVYLDSPEAAFAPANLNPTASFRLIVVNQLNPGQDYFKESSHKWSQQETDWGFTQFMALQELHEADRGFLVNDKVIIKVEITVQRDERYYYDSRKETGHVGLKNQGATCYMNSLLQYLFHLPYFRKAVYHMPTNENDQPSDSLPLALQSLFYKLQYSRTPVSTKDLTKSFGWSTMDAFMQHDVQELNRVLCEKLEEKMKGTRVEKVINELFEGHTLNFIECVNVDYKSSRRESFMDLQLDVKGCKDIYESFDRYVEVEVMDGENQYKAEGHGLQDARKGVLFDNFPPVLQLQLKRFEYDFQRDTMVKINDKYVFYDELDLDRDDGKYLSPQADRNVRNLYKLHSVLVHSGGVHGGHYYAYIRPDGKTWLKFDDTAVTTEDESKALNEQFGGEDEPLTTGTQPVVKADGEVQSAAPPKRLGGLKFTKFSNAYMLVYVRVSDWPRVMVPVTKDHIAPYLRKRLESEQREKEKRQKDKQEAHLYCHVRIATDSDIAQQVGSSQWFDLVDYDKLPADRTFRVRKLTPFADFKKQVADTLGIPSEQQRYWVWQQRQNKTYRPTTRLKVDEEDKKILDLRDHRETVLQTAKHALMDLRFYLEIPWPQQLPAQNPSRHDINLFFKYYDPEKETLQYVGHRYVPKNMKVKDLHPLLNNLAGLPDNTPLMCYEEVKWEPTVMVELLQPIATLGPQAQLENGDIICFQKAVSENVIGTVAAAAASEASGASMSVSGVGTAAAGHTMDVEVDQQQQQQGAGVQQQPGLQQPGQQQQVVMQCRYPRVPEFLSYIRNRRLVTFKKLEDPKEPGLQLELLREQDYDTVTAALAAKLGLDDPTKIRLTQHNAYSVMPQRAPMKFRGINKLENMLMHAGHSVDVLYYETLDMPLPMLEQLKSMKVQFHNDKTEFVAEHVIRLPHDSQVEDVLRELSSRLGAEYSGRKLRLLEVYHSKIFKVIAPNEEISTVNDNYWLLRAEPVPQDQEQDNQAARDRIIHVCHISTNNGTNKAESAGNNSPTSQSAPTNDAAGGGFIGTAPATTAATVNVFGDPFLFKITAQETVGAVKARIQEKLGIAAADFEQWKFAFVPVHAQLEYLADDDVLAEKFAAAEGHHGVGQDVNYLGLEHEDKGPKRPAGARHTTYERAVKIYS